MRERDERAVVVPALGGAALEVVEPERVFELAVVVLDAPTALGERDQYREHRRLGQVGEPVLARLGGTGRPFADKPAAGQLAATVGAAQLEVGRAYAQAEKARAQLAAARALAPSDLVQVALARGHCERAQRGRLLAVAGLRRPALASVGGRFGACRRLRVGARLPVHLHDVGEP